MKKILLICLLICMLVQPVSAHEVPDLTRQGSISVTMHYQGDPVSGGELTLYRVGDIIEEDGNYSFTPTAKFLPSGVSFEKVHAYETAKKLASFVKKEKLAGTAVRINSKGTANFEDIEPGLYLLMQNKAAQGYACINPFLVSVPMRTGDDYMYHVDASPKVSPVTQSQPENPEQPQTGQSGWPFWTFAISGAALLILLRRRRTL